MFPGEAKRSARSVRFGSCRNTAPVAHRYFLLGLKADDGDNGCAAPAVMFGRTQPAPGLRMVIDVAGGADVITSATCSALGSGVH
jgi:hypothetical protein